jgi:hemoglobin/transferrin/lactoferrin receptor protein
VVVGGELWHRALLSQREKHLSAAHKIVGERPVPASAYMSGGAFAQDDWNVSPGRLRAVFGARYDRSRTHNDLTFNPEYVIVNGVKQLPTPGQVVLWPSETSYDESWSANAGAHLAVTRHATLSLLLATAFRSPSLEERYQFLDLGSSLHVGNPALEPERSLSLNAGGSLDFERTSLRLDAFGNRLTNLVSETPGTFEGRTTNVFVKTNIGEARLYGFELSGEQRLAPGAALRASLAYVRGEDTRHHVNLAQIAPLSGHAELDVNAARAGTLRFTCDAAHTQGNPAAGEAVTPGWAIWGASLACPPLPAGAATIRLRAGVENAFDRAYRLHLTTLRGLVKSEPGRNVFASATLAF